MVVECTFRCNNGLWTDSGNDGGKGCAAIPSVGIAEPGGRSGSHCPLHTYVDIPYVYIYICMYQRVCSGVVNPLLKKASCCSLLKGRGELRDVPTEGVAPGAGCFSLGDLHPYSVLCVPFKCPLCTLLVPCLYPYSTLKVPL